MAWERLVGHYFFFSSVGSRLRRSLVVNPGVKVLASIFDIEKGNSGL